MMAGAYRGTNKEEESSIELSSLTISQLRALAQERGYTITATKKADIIAEIEAQQEAEHA